MPTRAYQGPRPRKLSPAQEAEIRVAAGALTLRELAADFGVSHETVRGVIRRSTPEPVSEPATVPSNR